MTNDSKPGVWWCDFCGRTATRLGGESNHLLLCDQCANQKL